MVPSLAAAPKGPDIRPWLASVGELDPGRNRKWSGTLADFEPHSQAPQLPEVISVQDGSESTYKIGMQLRSSSPLVGAGELSHSWVDHV